MSALKHLSRASLHSFARSRHLHFPSFPRLPLLSSSSLAARTTSFPPSSPSFHPLQQCLFATRSSSAADSYLVEVLKSEIEHELHEEADKKGKLKGSTGPFELVDEAGTEEVILKRVFGNEQIVVTCIMESEYPEHDEEAEEEEDEEAEEVGDKAKNGSEDEEEEEEEGEAVNILRFTVTITKDTAMPALEFECSFFKGSDEVTIESVSFLNEDSSDKKPRQYEGPEFSNLDENLQRAFHDLLKARGLSPKVATYVMDYLELKEHREYMRWLHNLESFFSS